MRFGRDGNANVHFVAVEFGLETVSYVLSLWGRRFGFLTVVFYAFREGPPESRFCRHCQAYNSGTSWRSVCFNIFVCDVVFTLDTSEPNNIDTVRSIVLDRNTCAGSRGKNQFLLN